MSKSVAQICYTVCMATILENTILPTGEEIQFRLPEEDDVAQMLDYINRLSSEQTYILRQGDQLSLSEETEYVMGLLKKMNERKSVCILAICDGKIVGNSGIDLQDGALGHDGVFGISIAKEYRGKGIGRLLMEKVLERAQESLPELRIITLGVFGENTIARKMYEKFGFVEYGRLPEGIQRQGKLDDHIFMFKKVR